MHSNSTASTIRLERSCSGLSSPARRDERCGELSRPLLPRGQAVIARPNPPSEGPVRRSPELTLINPATSGGDVCRMIESTVVAE
jgi:hypothetical protein